MSRVLRRKINPAPTEDGVYYGRQTHSPDIVPLLVYTNGDKSRDKIYEFGSDDSWNDLNMFVWYGPVPKCRAKR
jgi:hypothetical protein